ncbi:PQQ-binding-like beta-propeller repeat protein [Rhodococcus sp. IEGM 1408]|uniref:Rv3212 family protein n=1 Tax=Rhodococcus sp. IEGM 1408 TaxID=3082220 RepID=UPI002955DD03|nr:PQQ-binding-like beta-propeller repeat protein [Rhodococcus sp. IEGM 1408]MDV8000861.1 PQQ-binding-like beta-propeller repeat protein [Rhodococcus sp. IEGM 1408]
MRTSRSSSVRRGRPFLGVSSERTTRRDLITAGIIALVMIVAAAVVLLSGSAARSEFRTADAEQPVYGPTVEAPTSLQPLWTHGSGGTGAPLTTKGNLVTVTEDGTLVGRDAGSGEERWTYSNAGRFCAATFYADSLVAAFDGASGCSDVTSVDPTSQQYESTRQSDFPDAMELGSTWKHALALSPQRLEIWRDDLVRTVEYGAVSAPQEAGMQPRTGCTLGTADLTDERFVVSERCPGEDSERLTFSKTVPEDNRKPEELASAPTGADGLWIIEVSDEGVLALRNQGADWTVDWFTSPTQRQTVLILGGEPARKPSLDTVSGDDGQARWFDGAQAHAFDTSSGAQLWASPATGPGLTGGWSPDPEAATAGPWVLLPLPDGFSLLDRASGTELRPLASTPLPGEGVRESVTGLAQIGDILYERRAGAIHAYKLVA